MTTDQVTSWVAPAAQTKPAVGNVILGSHTSSGTGPAWATPAQAARTAAKKVALENIVIVTWKRFVSEEGS